jgi:hypothetical protein
MGVLCWVDVTLNSSLMILLDSNFARVFLNQDVEVSSPQPQPLDGIASAQATPWVPWVDSAPRAVQVVFRHCAIDLMLLLCQNRQERGCNPPFLTSAHSNHYSSMRIARAAESRRSHASKHPLVDSVERTPRDRTSRRAWSSREPPISRFVLLRKERSRETLQARPLITAWSPTKLDSNRTHLG